jgi:hypothetical protein
MGDKCNSLLVFHLNWSEPEQTFKLNHTTATNEAASHTAKYVAMQNN